MGLTAGHKIQVRHKENLPKATDGEACRKHRSLRQVKALGGVYTNLCPGMTDTDKLMAVQRTDAMSPLGIVVLQCLLTISVQKHQENPPQTTQEAGF